MTTTCSSDAGKYGYGSNPRVSLLQQQWQTQHPTFAAIQAHQSVKVYMSKNPIARSLGGDLAWLLPDATPSLFHDKPRLIDYVQLPLYLWIPDWFLPHLVPYVPCPLDIEQLDKDGNVIGTTPCDGVTTRQRWRSGGPRVIHDINSAIYLHCCDYVCKKHPKKPFAGWNHQSITRMHPTARATFKFILSGKEGVTLDVHTRIINSRLNGSSFQALYQELKQNRYNRLYQTIAAYYRHQEDYRKMIVRTPFRGWMPGFGATSEEEDADTLPMPPILHNPNGYHDHLPLSKQTISTLYESYCQTSIPSWSTYTQQLTAPLVSLDATFKIALKLHQSSLTRLWTLIDITTGVILHLQMLTHETHNDILPMLMSYRARCQALNAPLPTRVCSDRGLMDAAVIQDPRAFPDAHINVDNWHFIQLFANTLNRKDHLLFNDVKTAFSRALYQSLPGKDGKMEQTHAEPQPIITAVAQIIERYSRTGNQDPVITNETREWWSKQTGPIVNKRICSNPYAASTPMKTVSSSFQENYHRQLNRLIKIIKMSEETMHCFLLHHMYHWNIARRRAAKLEYDWHTSDLDLVQAAFEAVVRVTGRSKTGWNESYSPPQQIPVIEHFGILHPHVTLTEKLKKASDKLPFHNDLVELIVSQYSASIPVHSVLPKAQISIDHFVKKTPKQLPQPIASTSTASSSLSLYTEVASTSSSIGGRVLPPAQRLVLGELSLFQAVIQKDELMQQLTTEEQWDVAASRWNAFIDHATKQCPEIKGLHMATGEIIEKAMKALQSREEVNVERKMIEEQHTHPGIPYTAISASEQKFSEYEKNVLIQLVPRHTNKQTKSGKPRIEWSQVSFRWQNMYTAEMLAKQQAHLYPREKEVLKTQYANIRQIVDGTGAKIKKRKNPDSHSTSNDVITDDREENRNDVSATTVEEKDTEASNPVRQSVSASASSSMPTITFHIAENKQWSKDATTHFEKLYKQYKGRWSYKQFVTEWPSEELGEVGQMRWYNKNKNMRDRERKANNEAAKSSEKKQKTGESLQDNT